MKKYGYMVLSLIIVNLLSGSIVQAAEEANEPNESIERTAIQEANSAVSQEEQTAVQNSQPEQLKLSDFRILSERNIFSRNRAPLRVREERKERPRRQAPVVLSIFTLRGIAIKGAEKTAFIEEEIAGDLIRVTEGESIAQGTVKEIRRDRIIFEQNGREREIVIGNEINQIRSGGSDDSENVVSEVSDGNDVSEETAVEPVTAEQEETNTSTGADEDEILRRMLERRRQQIGD